MESIVTLFVITFVIIGFGLVPLLPLLLRRGRDEDEEGNA